MARLVTAVAFVALALLTEAWCEAGTIYYATAYTGTPGCTQLATVDPSTGEVTRIGSPMSNPNQIHGLVMTNDGRLFGINGVNDNFYFVNPVTGQAELVGSTEYQVA